jgi:hypothetical protein
MQNLLLKCTVVNKIYFVGLRSSLESRREHGPCCAINILFIITFYTSQCLTTIIIIFIIIMIERNS